MRSPHRRQLSDASPNPSNPPEPTATLTTLVTVTGVATLPPPILSGCSSNQGCLVPIPPEPERTTLTFSETTALPSSGHMNSDVTSSSTGLTADWSDGAFTTNSGLFQITSRTSAGVLPTNTSNDSLQSGVQLDKTRKAIGLGVGLGALALLLSICVGIWLGMWYQRKRRSAQEKQERYEKPEADGKEIRKEFVVELPAEREPAELPDNSTRPFEDS